ncbi:MAG: hypothetical protein Edafosvirus5_26 [Edafosvirus sp.]|uniref:Endonuclease/exonuclease/phosphatase domain-containing protein n=1 Tax=Edafosvirus sp. TaxID=2487765 RepID=A0A3G4ZT99_9VIRU|nr:MAG: hypothetical protein Edafosvirus5_26 [Edafosvirus sp.]
MVSEIKLLSYNVLADFFMKDVTDCSKRKDQIIKYIVGVDADIICLQEVTDIVLEDLKKLPLFQMVCTDCKDNNVVILTKYKIISSVLIKFNFNKQAIFMKISTKDGFIIQLIGVHLTSSMSRHSIEKRKKQIAMIMATKELDMKLPTVILGDFNVESDSEMQDSLAKFTDVGLKYGSVNTYDPSNNKLAFLVSPDKTSKRLDRIYINSLFNINKFVVKNDLLHSDHFPIECIIVLV